MKIIESVLNLLYPPKCVFCQKLLNKDERGVCGECSVNTENVPENDRVQKFRNIEKCVSPLYYKKNVKESLHRFKFSGRTGYAEYYSEIIYEALTAEKICFDVISWIPLSRKRLRERGYDQAKLLADRLAGKYGMISVPTLKKIRNVKAQSVTGDAEARAENIKGAYTEINHENFVGKKVLLIDDIVTTGSTLSEAAGVLLENGCCVVYAATVARSVDDI